MGSGNTQLLDRVSCSILVAVSTAHETEPQAVSPSAAQTSAKAGSET
jgi:hypothetical protein